MKRNLCQIKSPIPPKKIYNLKETLSCTRIDLHQLQDWTRHSDRAYFKPTIPARGQGTRQGFAFKDLFVLGLIRFLKLVNIRQHLVLDIINAINNAECQKYLINNPKFNFLDENCLLETDTNLEYEKFCENIKYLEIRSCLYWNSKKYGTQKSNFTIMKKQYAHSNSQGKINHDFYSILPKEDYFFHQLDLTFITQYLQENLHNTHENGKNKK